MNASDALPRCVLAVALILPANPLRHIFLWEKRNSASLPPPPQRPSPIFQSTAVLTGPALWIQAQYYYYYDYSSSSCSLCGGAAAVWVLACIIIKACLTPYPPMLLIFKYEAQAHALSVPALCPPLCARCSSNVAPWCGWPLCLYVHMGNSHRKIKMEDRAKGDVILWLSDWPK